jgi:tartronate-semialdehyde synthase
LSFNNINCPEIGEYGVDHVKATEALGCLAFRVFEPGKIAATIQKARALAEERRVPVVVEVITERATDIAMGPEIDKVTEFEETIDLATPEDTEAQAG